MASTTMTTSFLGGSAVATFKAAPTTARRGVVVAQASKVTQGEKALTVVTNGKEESNSTMRRDLVFAAAAGALCSIAKAAMADEPKNGTPEAKKKYAPVCVTMPTARICKK